MGERDIREDILVAADKLFSGAGLCLNIHSCDCARGRCVDSYALSVLSSKELIFQTWLKSLWEELTGWSETFFDHEAPIDTELRRFAGTMASRLTHAPTIARLRPVIAEVVMKPNDCCAALCRAEFIGAWGSQRLSSGLDEARCFSQRPILTWRRCSSTRRIKDGVFWPTLLGAQELGILSDVERILDESVTLFLTRYGAPL